MHDQVVRALARRSRRVVAGLALWCAVWCALPVELRAQVAAGSARISFGDAVRIALQQNITLQQAENARALSAVTVQQQRNQFLPNFNLNTNTSRQCRAELQPDRRSPGEPDVADAERRRDVRRDGLQRLPEPFAAEAGTVR